MTTKRRRAVLAAFSMCITALVIVLAIPHFQSLVASPRSLAIEACDEWVISSTRASFVTPEDRKSHMHSALANAQKAAKRDEAFSTLLEELESLDRILLSESYEAISMTRSDVDIIIQSLIGACMAAGQGP